MSVSPGFWPLLNGSTMRLMAYPDAQDCAPKFSNLFRATWSRLPVSVQNTLIAKWEASDDGCPTFVLHYDLDDHALGIGTYGVHSDQARFDFSAVKLRKMPDRLVETLIAHELGHCVLGHTGDYLAAHESEADTLVSSWGFPMNELREFLRI